MRSFQAKTIIGIYFFLSYLKLAMLGDFLLKHFLLKVLSRGFMSSATKDV